MQAIQKKQDALLIKSHAKFIIGSRSGFGILIFILSLIFPFGASSYASAQVNPEAGSPEDIYPPIISQPDPVGSISGRVFVQNGGGIGIANITILLYQLSGGNYILLSSTLTNGFGEYSFSDLVAGTYHVFEVQPVGLTWAPGVGTAYQSTVGGVPTGTVTSLDSISDIVLGAGDIGIDYNFGDIFRKPR